MSGQIAHLGTRPPLTSARSIWVLAMVLACILVTPTMANPFLRDIAKPGNEAYQAEDFSRAAQEYLKAQDLEPLSAELRFNLGSAYLKQEEFDKATEEFTEAARADDPKTAASAYYNLGNAKYKGAKRTFEAGMVAGATQAQPQEGDPVQVYVKKLEECIQDYQETLKRTPNDTDAKYNIEMIRREIKNLMRRQEQKNQQQNQQQKQDQKDQQQNQDQQNKDQQQQQQEQKQDEQKQDQQQQNQQGGQSTPTPQPMAQMPTPSPTGGQGENKSQEQQQPTSEPTQMLSISEEMARNLLDNLPEQRPRVRPRQRQKSEKDW
jgi:Ca-activated chloride channel homolog